MFERTGLSEPLISASLEHLVSATDGTGCAADGTITATPGAHHATQFPHHADTLADHAEHAVMKHSEAIYTRKHSN